MMWKTSVLGSYTSQLSLQCPYICHQHKTHLGIIIYSYPFQRCYLFNYPRLVLVMFSLLQHVNHQKCSYQPWLSDELLKWVAPWTMSGKVYKGKMPYLRKRAARGRTSASSCFAPFWMNASGKVFTLLYQTMILWSRNCLLFCQFL